MGIEISQDKIKESIEKYRNAKFVHNGRSLEEGIDCLGFLIEFYKDFGIEIPSDDGKPIEKNWYLKDPERYVRGIKKIAKKQVGFDQLQPLDLVYFVVRRNIITHTGVMINGREFAHMSPKSGFLISKLERHWKRRLRGAVRLI